MRGVPTGFDAARLFPQLLLSGDLEGAGDALTNPDALTPEQQKEWIPNDDGPFAKILRIAANPLVMAGVALSMAYPVASASGLFKFEKVVGGLVKKINPYSKPLLPLWNKVQSATSIFYGTKWGEYLKNAIEDAHQFKSVATVPLGLAIDGFETTAGRAMNLKERIAAGILTEGIQDPTHKVWQTIRGIHADQLREAGYGEAEISHRVSQIGLKNPEKLRAMVPETIDQAFRDSMNSQWEMFATPENLERLAGKDLRGMMGRLNNLTGDARKEMLKEIRKARGDRDAMFDVMDAMGVELGVDRKNFEEVDGFIDALKEAVKTKNYTKIEGYYPHVESKSPGEIGSRAEQMADEVLQMKPEEWEARVMANVEPTSDRWKKRLNRMIPDYRDLEMLGPDHVDPYTMDVLKGLSKVSPETPGFRLYSLRLPEVASFTAHSTSKAYAFTARGWGKLLKEEYETLAREDTQGIKKYLARHIYMPAVMGKLDPTEAVHALAWGDLKYKAHQFFQTDEVREKLGPRIADFFKGQLERPGIQNLTFKNAGAKLAGWFYHSALGLNPASAGINLMQNMMTTAGVVDPKYLAGGLREAMGDMGKVAEEWAKGGKSLSGAFETALPHYVKYVGTPSEIQALSALRRSTFEGGGPWDRKLEKAKSVMMSMFTGTERFNKLWAFHAGRLKALAEGAGELGYKGRELTEWSNQIGKQVMEVTQFPGGIMGTASGLVNTWAPLRQFSQFPLRTAELATSMGMKLGAAEKSLPDWLPVVGGGNPGTTARMVAAAGLTYGVGKEFFGRDLSRGLMFGAMPLPENPDQPFYPWPIVPPVLALPGALASDLFSGGGEKGDFAQTKRTLPLLVPGGVSLARASTVMAPALARRLGRSYADFSQRLPSGEVALYTANGELKGYEKPVSLVARSVGWNSLGGDPEADLTKYLVAQRDKMRGIRRNYIEALANNDPEEALKIEEGWKHQFPQLGEIQVKPSDIRAVHLRHDVSRVERILETMPKESRATYAPMISVALGDTAEQFLGVDPELLSGGTVRTRDPHRAPNQRASSDLGGPGGGNQEPRFRTDHAGQKPKSGFENFQAFEGF